MTLQELYDQHPDWRDLPLVVYDDHRGGYDYVGNAGSASVYIDKDTENIPVLVFTGN
jgi:hypothetical protein